MRPGITIQHAREMTRESDVVRSDVTGFIGVIPKARWPQGTGPGDFIELAVSSIGDLRSSPAVEFLDPATLQAVHHFFINGGVACRVFGLCIESERDLMAEDPFSVLFHALLDRLRGEEDIGLLVMPILAYLPITFESGGRARVLCQPTMELLLEHCREMNNRFLILDTPRDLHEDALIRWVRDFQERNGENVGRRAIHEEKAGTASYGAIYYPWLHNGDELFPPSGCVAGIFARSEVEHAPFGVRWPPANQVMRGVTHPAVPVQWREVDRLTAAHINPILTQPARGVVVWGARTLSRDPKWMHINSRRITSFIAEQLRRDSEWVVFENQRPELYEIVRRTVKSRLDMLWGGGLLTGEQAGLEYHVQCDSELNPPEVRDAGQVNVKVLIRPISTAEYIVVELRLGT